MANKVHCNDLRVATYGGNIQAVQWKQYYSRTFPFLHAFMIHGNKVNIFQCVAVTVNNGNGKEEASEE